MRSIAALQTPEYCAVLADYPGGTRQGWHAHDEAVVTLILAGEVREAAGRGEQSAGPMQVGVKPAGLRHTDYFGPAPVRALRIAFAPASRADAHRFPAPTEWTWHSSPGATRGLTRAAHAIHSGGNVGTDDAIWDAVAGLDARDPAPVRGDPPQWLQRARERLLDCTDRHPLRTLALDAGVHPVYFAAQFRRYFGCSTSRFRQLRRLERAADLLRATAFPLSQIAAMLGYADQAHLTREFGKSIGVSPRRYRLLLSGESPSNRSRSGATIR